MVLDGWMSWYRLALAYPEREQDATHAAFQCRAPLLVGVEFTL